MSDHVDPAILVDLAEGRLSAAEAAAARTGLAACPHCARHFEDLTMLARVVAKGDGTREGEEMDYAALSPALDRALEDVIQRHIRPRIAPRRAWFGIAAAAAAVLLVFLIVPRDGKVAEGPFLRGAAVYEAAPGGLRSGSGDTLHFEMELSRAFHLAIFRVSGATVDVVYPDPNPTLGTYGRTTPFGAGEHVRIPPTPLADLPASRAASPPAFLAVASTAPIAAPALAAALASARSAASGGAAAVQAALTPHFEAVVPLAVR